MKEIPEIEELKKFKKRSGWSYHKISTLMGVHSQTIVYWIKGKYNPSIEARGKIRRFLDDFSY